MNNVPSDFKLNFNEDERKRRINALWDAFGKAGYWVDRLEDRETLLSIATEFNIGGDYNYSDLASLWVRFPNGCTERRNNPEQPYTPAKYIISQAAHKFNEFRAFLREVQREHNERQAKGDLYTSRIKPYQYTAGYVDHQYPHRPPGRHFEGVFDKYGRASNIDAPSLTVIQGRAVVDKLFDLVEHAEKAEAGRERLLEELRALRTDFGGVRQPVQRNDDVTLYTACLVEHADEIKTSNYSLVEHAQELKATSYSLVEHAEKADLGRERADLGRERILEELRGLRLELGQLARPSRSNSDRTFYVACGCLGVLVLMLFFK
jgi:hypothetical protein